MGKIQTATLASIVLISLIWFERTIAVSNAETAKSSPDESVFLPIVADNPPAVIKGLHYQSTMSGGIRIIGEVIGLGDHPLFNVTIGASGTVSDTQVLFTGTTVFTATLPGQTNVFDLYLPGNMEGIEIFVHGLDLNDQRTHAPLLVTGIETSGCCGSIFVTVELENGNPFPLVNVVGFAFSWGSFSDLNLVEAADYLAAGETVQFGTLLQGIEAFDPVFALGQGEIPP